MCFVLGFAILGLVYLYFSARYSGNPRATNLLCRFGFHQLRRQGDDYSGKDVCIRPGCDFKEDVNPYVE